MNQEKLQTLKAEDTLAPVEFFGKNGYYTVGNKIFNHKILALQYATTNDLPVKWEFNSKEFKKIDWRQRLGVDIRVLYRQRAQQLRDKYSYLMLGWSGGGDSSTVLRSFVDNGIKLDEVVILWPRSQTQGKYQPSLDTRSENMLSEWDLAIKPQIDQLKSACPDLNITLVDYMTELNLNEDRDDTALILEKNNYGSLQKYRAADDLIQQRVKTYKDVAYIMGASPVDIELYDGWAGVVFSDTQANPGFKSDLTLAGWQRNIELFYWTPDLPELIREQAHMMLDYYTLHPEKIPLTMNLMHLDKSNYQLAAAHSRGTVEHRRQIQKMVLYPDYPINTFQTVKPNDHMWKSEMFDWLWTNPEVFDYIDSWQSHMKSHHTMIDPKYKVMQNGKVIRYSIFRSGPYLIGKIPDECMARAFPDFSRK